MHKKVYWRLFLNTNKLVKAKKLTKQVVEVIGSALISKLEPYWKDTTVYELELKASLSGVDIQNAVFRLINTISSLSGNWQVTIEDCRADSYVLSGVTERNITIVGVRWASFTMY